MHSFVPASVNNNRGSSRSQLNAATAFPMEIPKFDVNTSPVAATASQPKVGVLLLNLGGPETGDDVEGMLCSWLEKFSEWGVFSCVHLFSRSRWLTFNLNYIRRIFVQSL